MTRKLFLPLAAALLVMLLGGCSLLGNTEADRLVPVRTDALYALSQQLTGYIAAGDYDAALAMMDEAMQEAMGGGKLEEVWNGLLKDHGALRETGSYLGTVSGEYDLLEMALVFESGRMTQRTAFGADDRIAGLYFVKDEVSGYLPVSYEPLPQGVREEEISFAADPDFPLGGTLTLPEGEGPWPAVVLVHGSGPSGRDEVVMVNTPLRDLALGLAARGIAVLRYDKRTYTYGMYYAEGDNAARITVDEESVFDTVAAVELLRERADIGSVYLAGHSLGGGLLSYIDLQGADSAGYIVLAGSPRKLWQLAADQNELYAGQLENEGEKDAVKQIRAAVADAVKLAGTLSEMTDEQALDTGNAPFDISAWYLRHLESIDPIAEMMADKKPVLILQGGRDRQVYAESDFVLWQSGLEGHPDASFILYPELNHIFGLYTGEEPPFDQLVSTEYAARTPVDSAVLDDIADWILAR